MGKGLADALGSLGLSNEGRFRLLYVSLTCVLGIRSSVLGSSVSVRVSCTAGCSMLSLCNSRRGFGGLAGIHGDV